MSGLQYHSNATYDELPPNAQDQIRTMLEVAKAQPGGENITIEMMTRAALKLRSENVTCKWGEKCGPIANWLNRDPELAWFVDTKRLAQEGAKTAEEIKRERPSLGIEEHLNALYSVLYEKLLSFAVSKGYKTPG